MAGLSFVEREREKQSKPPAHAAAAALAPGGAALDGGSPAPVSYGP